MRNRRLKELEKNENVMKERERERKKERKKEREEKKEAEKTINIGLY